ncbi:MAG TPA: hypothetical protein VFT99_25265 [Roseiflexaceae bacterium]|nr:hypothetical protein [Roseiflexaceae bacterium]
MDSTARNDTRSYRNLVERCQREAALFRHAVEEFRREVLLAQRIADELIVASRIALASATTVLAHIDIGIDIGDRPFMAEPSVLLAHQEYVYQSIARSG